MCISQSVRGRVALGGAELFPGLGVVGSHPPCASPPAMCWELPVGLTHPLPAPHQAGLPVPRFPCGVAMLGVAVALTWHRWAGTWWGWDMGTGVSDPSPSLGGLPMQGLILSLSVTLCSALQACPSRGAAPSLVPTGVCPSGKWGLGPTVLVQPGGYGAGHGSIHSCPTVPHLPGFPKLQQPCLWGGAILATLKGAPCNLGSWQPGKQRGLWRGARSLAVPP